MVDGTALRGAALRRLVQARLRRIALQERVLAQADKFEREGDLVSAETIRLFVQLVTSQLQRVGLRMRGKK